MTSEFFADLNLPSTAVNTLAILFSCATGISDCSILIGNSDPKSQAPGLCPCQLYPHRSSRIGVQPTTRSKSLATSSERSGPLPFCELQPGSHTWMSTGAPDCFSNAILQYSSLVQLSNYLRRTYPVLVMYVRRRQYRGHQCLKRKVVDWGRVL